MNLKNKLTNGEFSVIAEMSTPKGVDISDLVTSARNLKSRVDAVVIPDMDNGVMHMSAIAGAALVRQQGIEPMIHVYGRDRNRMALQGDMLAAHVLGIPNLLVVQGEEMSLGDHQDAKLVDDLNERDILVMVDTLKKGSDLAGFELKGSPDFFAGCQVNPMTDDKDLDAEFNRAKEKVDAGAQFIIVPPVFDKNSYPPNPEKFKSLDVAVIATVFLLKNVGMARYISINDPGSRLTDALITRIRTAKDRETECIAVAGEMIQALGKVVHGVKISAMGWEDRLPAILDSAGI